MKPMVNSMDKIDGNVTGRKPNVGQTTTPILSVDPAELLDASETAKLLRQKVQTLATWRCENRGPEYLKCGRAVFYRRSAISAWLAEQIVRPTAA
jgi:predicted DNA-binding transcriptional regulator AlpA